MYMYCKYIETALLLYKELSFCAQIFVFIFLEGLSS